MSENAKNDIENGATYPFDASDSWRNDHCQPARAPMDWTHAAAARGILENLKDRREVKSRKRLTRRRAGRNRTEPTCKDGAKRERAKQG